MARHWTEEEDAELTRMWNARERPGVIAAALWRPHGGVMSRAEKLGLKGRRLGAFRTHPVYSMNVGESVFIPGITKTQRRQWSKAAVRGDINIITRTRIVGGQTGCRITRIAA